MGELWLLNRDQSNCRCCNREFLKQSLIEPNLEQPPSKIQPAKHPDKSRVKQGHRSVSPRIEKTGSDSQVTVITIQPQKQTSSGNMIFIAFKIRDLQDQGKFPDKHRQIFTADRFQNDQKSREVAGVTAAPNARVFVQTYSPSDINCDVH
jgi:hypothetical protein